MSRITLVFLLMCLCHCQHKVIKKQNKKNFLSGKKPYAFKKEKLLNLNKSCEIIHVEGLYRHGSRYLARIDPIKNLIKSLANKKKLMPEAKRLLSYVKGLEKNILIGEITKQGEREQTLLGKRFYRRYQDLFKGPSKTISLEYTSVIRTKQSQNSFVKGFLTESKLNQKIFKELTNLNPIKEIKLRPYRHCQKFLDYRAQNPEEKYLVKIKEKTKSIKLLKKILGQITPDKISTTPSQEDWDLVQNIYKICQQDHDIDQRTAASKSCRFFDQKSLKLFKKLSDTRKFYEIGPYLAPNEETSKTLYLQACPLLNSFVNNLDAAIQNRSPRAHLRFAHAETLGPLLSFMMTSKKTTKKKKWSMAQNLFMSSHVNWVLLKCHEKNTVNYQVKFIINEKERKIKIPSCENKKSCSWTLVKKYFVEHLRENNLNTCSQKDWNRYCQNT